MSQSEIHSISTVQTLKSLETSSKMWRESNHARRHTSHVGKIRQEDGPLSDKVISGYLNLTGIFESITSLSHLTMRELDFPWDDGRLTAPHTKSKQKRTDSYVSYPLLGEGIQLL